MRRQKKKNPLTRVSNFTVFPKMERQLESYIVIFGHQWKLNLYFRPAGIQRLSSKILTEPAAIGRYEFDTDGGV